MNTQRAQRPKTASQKAALRRRIRGLYRLFNSGDLAGCFEHVDPRLREAGRVVLRQYVAGLRVFRQRYGAVHIWHLDVSLHLDARNHKHDDRPFAYAYVFWQDDRKAFHVFRERWVKDSRRWYTRVAGLAAHETTGGKG